MPQLYRICRNIYNPNDPAGASITPGRWHILGEKVLYFCSSLAMCVLELRANSISFASIRNEYHYTEIEVEHELFVIEEVSKSFYVKDWTLNRQLTQKYGSDWYKKNKSSLLKVQSAVLPTDSNFILNTMHPDFSKIKFSKSKIIPLDPRVN